MKLLLRPGGAAHAGSIVSIATAEHSIPCPLVRRPPGRKLSTDSLICILKRGQQPWVRAMSCSTPAVLLDHSIFDP
jgi:hypothetical protein